jgi:hypothetical protein
VLDSIDRWVNSGPFTVTDLAVFRIVISLAMLLRFKDLRWVSSMPPQLYLAPPGPFRIFHSFPSAGIMVGIEILLMISIVAMLVGFLTVPASIAVTVLSITAYGFSYSAGKIDHSILYLLAPLILCWSGWGEAFSVDALRSGPNKPRAFRPWAVRVYAVVIGLGFLTAARTKFGTGWLQLHSHQTLIQVSQGSGTLTNWALTHRVPGVLWELGDWLTVALEAAVIVSVLWWEVFRVTVALLVFLHLGIFLLMGINFAQNVVAYGAFVAWSLPLRGVRGAIPDRVKIVCRRVIPILVVPLGVLSWWTLVAHRTHPNVADVSVAVLYLGSIFALGYLVHFVWRHVGRAHPKAHAGADAVT